MEAYNTYLYKEAFSPRDAAAKALRLGRSTIGPEATRKLWKTRT